MKTRLWAPMVLALAVLLAGCSSRPGTPEEVKLVESAPTTPQPRIAASFSVDGKILFAKGKDLWVWQNGNSKQLTSGTSYDGLAWSPDGKKIAAVSRAVNHSDLVVLNESGKVERKLTRFGPTPRLQDSSWARRPSWSPSGTKIAFSADLGTYRFAIWTVNSDGGGLARANYRALGEGDADSPTWSSDGKGLAFAAFWEPVSQIYVLNQSTGAVKKLTNHQQGAYDPSWSPDGDRIAYVARSEGKNDVWVMDADGANAMSVTALGTARAPTWSRDGQYIAFLAGQNQSFDLFVVKISVSAGGVTASSDPKQLTRGQPIDATAGISWAK